MGWKVCRDLELRAGPTIPGVLVSGRPPEHPPKRDWEIHCPGELLPRAAAGDPAFSRAGNGSPREASSNRSLCKRRHRTDGGGNWGAVRKRRLQDGGWQAVLETSGLCSQGDAATQRAPRSSEGVPGAQQVAPPGREARRGQAAQVTAAALAAE